MIKLFQKLIIAIVIIGLISSINFNLILIKPKTAQATDGGGSLMTVIKETILDAIGWVISDMVISRLATKIQDWGAGRTSDTNKPFLMGDWKMELKDIADIASARFVNEFNLTPLCSPFKISLGTALGINMPGGAISYRTYAACTIGDIVDNVEEFYKNPSIALYGWDTWTALAQPNNNFVGSFMMAQAEKERIAVEEKETKEKEIEAGQGAKNETICNATAQQQCAANCNQYPITINGLPNPFYVACMKSCEKSSTEVCLQKTVKNFGSNIKKSIDDALGKDMQRIISADEISELIGIFFSSVMNKAIDGMGLNSQPKSINRTTLDRSKMKEEYSYYPAFKKGQTAEEKSSIRNTILTTILSGIRQLTKSLLQCNSEKEMMSDLDFGKNAADISNANLEALYVAMEGVNLKPDFQVLDPLWAPFTVNGYSWGEVPSSKIPEKCKTIITQAGLPKGSTCKNIVSGLEPKKPTKTEIGFSYTGDCSQCMNNHDQFNCPPGVLPPQLYPVSPSKNPFTKGLMEQKTKFYNFCLDKKITIANRCTECTKKADEECNQTDKIQKEECIEQRCNNFQGIASLVNALIINGKDFYNKCLIEEKNSACLTCLREYFIPATYCEQIDDYMARSIVKYPAPLKALRDGDGHFIGPYDPYYDEINAGANECNNDADAYRPIDLSLICRIMPDFSYDNQFVCKTKCNITTEELEDITDFKPNPLDCGGVSLPIGGKLNVWEVLHQGQLATKGKCCAAVWSGNKEKYTMCVGGAPLTKEEEIKGLCEGKGCEKNPECCCDEGERFIGETATSWAPFFKCPIGQECLVSSQAGTCRKGCANFEFKVPDMKYINAFPVKTNPAPGGSVITISKNGCSDKDQESCVNGGSLGCDYTGELPNGIICQTEAYNSRNSTHCPMDGEHGLWQLGPTTMECDLSAYKGDNLYLSVISNQASDCKTTAFMCIGCDPSDSGYPNYGYQTNQCNNKIPVSER